MKKLIKITILLFTISGMVIPQTSFTTSIAKAYTSDENNEIMPYADTIKWRYKVIDGKLYKRQYNATKKKWVGDWVLA